MSAFTRAIVIGCVLAALAGRAGGQELDQDATLVIRAAIVNDDLTLHPLPRRRFNVTPEEASAIPVASATTDFSGAATLVLKAGRYRVASESPVEIAGRSFSWRLEVELAPATQTVLELSNDNAETLDVEAARAAVVEVVGEEARGTGFLVDQRGLVLTNHHVVSGSERIAVRLEGGRSFLANLIGQEPGSDLAVLQLNPEVVGDRTPLPLREGRPAVLGEAVVLIGYPLAAGQVSVRGTVARVEAGALYAEATVSPGNSGGPLLGADGKAIGIVTFRVGTAPREGMAGALPISLAHALLTTAAARLRDSTPPSPDPLPAESSCRVHLEALAALAGRPGFDIRAYRFGAGPFDIEVSTPVSALAERRRSLYEWHRAIGELRPVVTIEVDPELGRTPGASAAAALGWSEGAGRLAFKAAFDRLVLRRDGVRVEPLHAGRVRQHVHVSRGRLSVDDVRVAGRYEFPPEGFQPGAEVEIEIWQRHRPSPIVRTLKPDLLAAVWADFAPCRATATHVQASSPVEDEDRR